MTDTPIDNAITSVVIEKPSQGDALPDSNTILAASPQLIMEPGVAKPVFKFEDGDGLTDAFGNVYEGYGGAGGGSSVIVNDGDGGSNIIFSSDDPMDKYVWSYSDARQLWEPLSLSDAGIAQNVVEDFVAILIAEPENKTYKLINNSSFTLTNVTFIFEFAVGSGAVVLTQPAGIAPGGDQSIVVSGLSVDAEDLHFTWKFSYDLNEVVP